MQYVNVITDVYFGLWSDVVVDDETRDYLVAIINTDLQLECFSQSI
jgi:hypothetical protein